MNIDSRIAFAIATLLAAGSSAPADESKSVFVGTGEDAIIHSPTMTVSTLNVSHGRNTALNQIFVSKKRTCQNLDRIAALLDEIDADVVALQEADAPSKWSGKFDHVQYLVDNTDYNSYFHGHHARSWLYSYGTALLSKGNLDEVSSIDFAPSPPTTTKGFVRASFEWRASDKAIPVTVVSVHLDYSRKKVRDSQIEEMITALSGLDSELIIMGDLNSRWGDKRPHVRQLAEGLGLKVHDPDSAELGTYKSTKGRRLDWILISPGLEFADYKVLPDIVADHLLVYAEIIHRQNTTNDE